MFIFKTSESKNQVKASLTTEFIFNIKTIIDEKNKQDETPVRKRVKQYHNDFLTFSRININNSEKCDENTMPCNNIKCRWLQFLQYFYAKTLGYWLLPEVTPENHCEVCRLVNSGERKLSDFQISKELKVCIDGKVLV